MEKCVITNIAAGHRKPIRSNIMNSK